MIRDEPPQVVGQVAGRGVAPPRLAGQALAADGVEVAVLPGSLLAREANGVNPGAGRIRLALVAEVEECLEAAQRIVSYVHSLTTQ